jgi:transposase
MLVEAACAAARAPGPLRAFFIRIQSRRGKQVAAVATARKIAVLAWHLLTKDENYAWAGPALLANKIRKVELLADQPATKGRPTVAHMPITTAQPANGSWLEQAERAHALRRKLADQTRWEHGRRVTRD